MSRSSSADRRQWPRKSPGECSWPVDAKLRSGTEVRIVDLSNGGILLESTSQILPGARIELFLVARDKRWLVKGCVLRSQVSRVVRNDGVRYHAAMAFNEPLTILTETGAPPSRPTVVAETRPPFGRIRAFAVPASMAPQAVALEVAT